MSKNFLSKVFFVKDVFGQKIRGQISMFSSVLAGLFHKFAKKSKN